MLSAVLSLTVLDEIMKETTKDNRTGIRWMLTIATQLEDLHFAEDIALHQVQELSELAFKMKIKKRQSR